MSKLKTTPSPMALAIGAALLALGGSAAADVVLLAGSNANAGSSSNSPSSNSSNSYASSSSSDHNSQGSSSAYAFANSGGAYAVRSRVAGLATSSSLASFGQSLVNTSGVAQNYSMSFHVYGGYLSTNLYRDDIVLSAGEFLQSRYLAEISINGISVFSSGATVRRDANGTVTGSNKTGVDLNASDEVDDGYYSWGGADFTIDLGTIAAGGSIELLASLSDESSSNVGIYEFDPDRGYGYGCYGGGYENGGSGGTCFEGSAEAFYGDPINFSSSGDQTPGPAIGLFSLTATNATNDVPEPGMFGLAFLALGAAGWASRRRKI